MLRVSRYLTFLLISILAVAASASAQALDNTWFKMTVSASGYTIDGATGSLKRATFKSTAYLNLHWNATEHYYSFQIYSNVGSKKSPLWVLYDSGGFDTEGANEAIVTDMYADFGRGDDYVGGYMTLLLTFKRDKAGNVVVGTFNSLGGEATDGVIETRQFRGGLSVRSTLVKADKVPFLKKT